MRGPRARKTGFFRGAAALLATIALCGPLAARPQAATADPDTARFLSLLQRWGSDSDTFPVYVDARSFERETGASYTGQILAMMASELGMYDEAIANWPLGPGEMRSDPAAVPEGARAADAAATIARLARERRVVIINEAHHAAQTRALFLELMPQLRESGFGWYCAETLGTADMTRMREQGFPVRGSGTYSKEPIFGEVLRDAMRLGFTPCAYESIASDTQQARETGQAENLAHLLREHPDARILVHAGYGHARKDVTVNDAQPMAAELKRLTGIDPLTVDQTTLAPISPPERENPAYRPLLARLGYAARATVFIAADGRAWSLEPHAYDVSVVLPALAPRHGRAGWLWAIPGKTVVTGFDADCLDRYPCAIEARHAGESEDAVPADVIVRESGAAMVPALALFPGEYRIRAVAADGALLRETSLTVGAARP